MKFSGKDKVGVALVGVTLSVLAVHIGPRGHAARHHPAVADGGRSVTSARTDQPIAFVDVNVLPMDSERVLRHQVVVVEGGFIRRMGRIGVVEAPPEARVIQGRGTAFLTPGLTDAHVHLPRTSEEWLPLFLANGVTTVFNLRGDTRSLELRDRIRSGAVMGPTVYTSGPYTNLPEIDTPDAARTAVREQKAAGYDFIKVHGDLSSEVFRALTDAAREAGIAVVGHAPHSLPFAEVLENGQASVAHAEELIYTRFQALDTTELPGVAQRMAEAGSWLTPTLATFHNITTQWGRRDGLEDGLRSDAARYLPEGLLLDWRTDNPYISRASKDRPRIMEMYEFQKPLVRSFAAAGVPLLTGTDTPLPVMAPGFSLHDELAELEGAGLTPYEVLAAATRNAGRFVRENVDRSAVFGTVVVGARADLVLADSNPLDDLDVLRHPKGVMARGRWFDRSGLDAMMRRPGTR
jgi:imidazolonepropionase-like amidohydrolase